MKEKLTFFHKQPSWETRLKRRLTSLMFRYSSCGMYDSISRRSSSGTLSKRSRLVIDELERHSSSPSLIFSSVERWTEKTRNVTRRGVIRTSKRKTAKLVLILTNACDQKYKQLKLTTHNTKQASSFPRMSIDASTIQLGFSFILSHVMMHFDHFDGDARSPGSKIERKNHYKKKKKEHQLSQLRN
jgi:hypothetical protein